MKICKQCANGFLLQHLPYLVEVVEILGQRWQKGVREVGEAICAVARIGAKPFCSMATEDLLQYGKWLPSFVNAVISILQDAQPNGGTGTPDPQKDIIRIEVLTSTSTIFNNLLLVELLRLPVHSKSLTQSVFDFRTCHRNNIKSQRHRPMRWQ